MRSVNLLTGNTIEYMKEPISPAQKKTEQAQLQQTLAHNMRFLILLTAVLFIMICAAPLLTKVFSLNDLYTNTFGAVIGVALSAIITFVLLNGQSQLDQATNQKQMQEQSKQQLETERQATVYEERLKIYKEFLDLVLQAIKDKRLEEEQSLSLQFAVASLSMLSGNPSTVVTISRELEKIMNELGVGDDDNEASSSGACIMGSLMAIVEAFKPELYPNYKQDDNSSSAVLDSFQSIAEMVESVEDERVPMPEGWTWDSFQKAFTPGVQRGKLKGITCRETGKGLVYSLDALLGGMGTADFVFNYTSAHGFFFRVKAEMQNPEDARHLYILLRQNLKGQINKSGWWCSLPAGMNTILQGKGEKEPDEALKRHLGGRFTDVCAYLCSFAHLLKLREQLRTTLDAVEARVSYDISNLTQLDIRLSSSSQPEWTITLRETFPHLITHQQYYDIALMHADPEKLQEKLDACHAGMPERKVGSKTIFWKPVNNCESAEVPSQISQLVNLILDGSTER